jgi:hypothetical protein
MVSIKAFKIKLYVFFSALNRDADTEFAFMDGEKET